jgi:hypothetical protein
MNIHNIISCSQPPPAGASSTRRVSCGLIHFGGRDVVPTAAIYSKRRADVLLFD